MQKPLEPKTFFATGSPAEFVPILLEDPIVYILVSDDHLKIGRSKNVVNRVNQVMPEFIQEKSCLIIFDDAKSAVQCEAALHFFFRKWRLAPINRNGGTEFFSLDCLNELETFVKNSQTLLGYREIVSGDKFKLYLPVKASAVIEQASKAISNDDLTHLISAAERIELFISKQRDFHTTLHTVSKKLSDRGEYSRACMGSMLSAAFAPTGSEFQKSSIVTWKSQLICIEDDGVRQNLIMIANKYSRKKSFFEKATVEVWGSELEAGHMDVFQRINYAEKAASHARNDSLLEQASVQAWESNIRKLPNVMDQIRISRVTSRQTGNVELLKSCVTIWHDAIKTLPDIKERIYQAELVANHHTESPLSNAAANIWKEELEALCDRVCSIMGAERVLTEYPSSPTFIEAATSLWLTAIGDMPNVLQRLDSMEKFSRYNKSGINAKKACELWEKDLRSLTDVYDRINEAYHTARAPNGSFLETAAAKLWEEQVNSIADSSIRLKIIIRDGSNVMKYGSLDAAVCRVCEKLVDDLVINADHQIEAVRMIATELTPDSSAHSFGIRTWRRLVEKLDDHQRKLSAVTKAMYLSYSGSELEGDSTEIFKKASKTPSFEEKADIANALASFFKIVHGAQFEPLRPVQKQSSSERSPDIT